jgi:hypothetical protein
MSRRNTPDFSIIFLWFLAAAFVIWLATGSIAHGIIMMIGLAVGIAVVIKVLS